ncbi:MAG: GNAT family N-acetyltransferase [Thermoplasmata archaeon]
MKIIKIQEFDEDHIQKAAELFVSSYEKQREKTPILPKKKSLYDDVTTALTNKLGRRGFAAFEDGEMIGYMIETGSAENFMGKRTAFSLGLYSHSAVEDNRERIYQKLYERLSDTWIKKGYHAHIFSFWARDETLLFTLFRLGFGMTHFELMRDLSLPEKVQTTISIRRLDTALPIKKLEMEHREYYPKAPLFWLPWEDYSFQEEFQGCLLGAYDGDKIVAYMHLKTDDAETPLLASEDTCRVASAYAEHDYRGKGVGTALLREAVLWAKESDLKRLYVEGESANIQGGNFWMKHFEPVVYTVRRCVDERI